MTDEITYCPQFKKHKNKNTACIITSWIWNWFSFLYWFNWQWTQLSLVLRWNIWCLFHYDCPLKQLLEMQVWQFCFCFTLLPLIYSTFHKFQYVLLKISFVISDKKLSALEFQCPSESHTFESDFFLILLFVSEHL